MAANDDWYYAKDGQQLGPVSAAELKQLASTSQLSASDLIWKEGWADWKAAGTIKGLIIVALPATPVPPPLPPTSEPVSLPTTGNVTDTVKSDLNDLVSSARRTKDRAVALARRTQITQMTLPSAYLALGKEVFVNEQFRDQFSDLFQRITATNDEIAKVKASTKERPQATDLKGKLQSGAAQLMAHGQTATFGFQRESLVRELGKKAFESHGESAGSPDLVSPITTAIEEIKRLNARIAESSSGQKVPLWQRTPVAAMLTLFCFPVGLYLLWYNPRISRRTKLVWGGGFAAFFIFAMIVAQITAAKVREDLAAANQLWSSGDKQAAVSKYRTLVEDHLTFIPESDRSLVLGRVIDFDADSGNESSVESLLKKAEDEHVVPSVSSEKARSLISSRTAAEDFYPFTPGSIRQTIKTLYLGKLQIQSRHEIAHESGGIIRTSTLNKFTKPATGVDLPPDDPEENRYQKRNGFIEEGSKLENGPWFYEQVFKIGAKVGDTWKDELGHSYAVLPFETMEVEGKSVRCAVIEMTIAGSKGEAVCKVTTKYGQGVGPVSAISRVVNDNGGMETSWTENLVPTLKR